MSEQHTPGRLFVVESQGYWGSVNCHLTSEVDQASIGSVWVNSTSQNRADARRLVACWNACDGISTEHLELMTGDLSIHSQLTRKKQEKLTPKATEYRKQRDELLDAAKRLQSRGFFDLVSCADDATLKDMAAMREAIVKATRGTA